MCYQKVLKLSVMPKPTLVLVQMELTKLTLQLVQMELGSKTQALMETRMLKVAQETNVVAIEENKM